MNKTIGVLLVAGVGLALLLFTCTGPGGSDDHENPVSGSPEPSTLDEPDRDDRDKADAQRHEEEQVALTPVHASSTDNVKPAREPSNRSFGADASPPVFAAAALSPAPLPVAGVEALLAASPLSLEDRQRADIRLASEDSLRAQLRIPIENIRAEVFTDYTRGHPTSTVNTPTAFGPQWGDVYAGVGYQERIRYDDWTDGVASVGLGLGNPERYAGLGVSVNVFDTYTAFAEDRSLSVRLHRRLPYRSAIAVGHENVWHTDGTDGGSSRYAVVSKVLLFRDRPTTALGSMVVNVGIGTDRFLSEEAFARGEGGGNVFGGVAIRVLPPVNAVANWTGQDLALGLSIAPVRRWPLVVTPAVVDVTGRAGDGARFAVSAGLHYNFRR